MANVVVDIRSIYTSYFQAPYHIGKNTPASEPAQYGNIPTKKTAQSTLIGSPISETNSAGIEIFLPVTLWISEKENILIDCCTIRCTSKKTIIRTALSERIGSVREQFNVDDYQFTIKGVLIGKDRKFPDDQILKLKRIYESQKPVELRNAKAELLMEKTNRVAIDSLEFPEVEGKTIRHCPFVLVCESDFVDTLTLA